MESSEKRLISAHYMILNAPISGCQYTGTLPNYQEFTKIALTSRASINDCGAKTQIAAWSASAVTS
jgi:hypothetical protein